MPVAANRTQVWLTTLGDWRWPGAAQPADIAPPSWVPALPPVLEPAMAIGGVPATGGAHGGAPAATRGVARRTILARRLAFGAAAAALVATLATAALGGPRALERLVGERAATPPPAVAGAQGGSDA